MEERTKKGTTPGGRRYSATRGPSGKTTEVKSGVTTWTKTTKGGKPEKERQVHKGNHFLNNVLGTPEKTYKGVKGPTKPLTGLGKTESLPSGAKIRRGTTPGGRKYKAVKYQSGWGHTKVGGLSVNTSPSGGKVKASNSTGNKVAKGQTKPKGTK